MRCEEYLSFDEGEAVRGLTRQQRSARTRELLEATQRASDATEQQRLREAAVELNLRVAEAVAARYAGRGVAQEDLQQAAYEGLVKAIHRFDPAETDDLLTYAVPVIRGEVQRYFRDQSWTVRPPRRLQELQWQITQQRSRLEQQLGRTPGRAELAASLSITTADLDEGLRSFGCLQPPSLDQPVGHDTSLSVGAALAEPRDPREAVQARLVLKPLLQLLAEEERRILSLRFIEELSQREIGEELGLSQMQVSRTLRRILTRLRDGLADQPTAPPDSETGARGRGCQGTRNVAAPGPPRQRWREAAR